MFKVSSFAADYDEARDKFLAAARLADATMYRFDNPTKGPKGGSLSTDVAWVGPADASKIVMTISSTHGVEGFSGSGVQVNWLSQVGGTTLPADTALLFVHAINPYGFSWLRRVTEEGNDLNRNYADHSKPYPINKGYEEIHDWLLPRVSALVHHGGAGSTALALKAGIPSVTIYFGFDQKLWGDRVHALGAGPAPISAERLTAAALASAITEAIGTPRIRARAQHVASLIGPEDGVGKAVSIVRASLGRT